MVREVKDRCKSSSEDNPDVVTATFNLQQVIYLPKSERSEIFYKRRLACYNFTVYDIGSREGYCYLSHEGVTKRGSNEIASNLYKFLQKKDQQGAKEINLFCDGCPGQNKNTILPGMMHYFVTHSNSVQTVTLYFFETYHGQSEGDSMHSVIERAMRRAGNLYLPSQLAAVCRTARKRRNSKDPHRVITPYEVEEVSTEDILDWKEHSGSMGFLRCKEAADGTLINWKDFMAIRLEKATPRTGYIKMSHSDEVFAEFNIASGRLDHISEELPGPAYENARTLAERKYEDLKRLTEGPNPVIKHRDHVTFYMHLPH